MTIQAVFGWGNAHLFQFSKKGLSDPDAIGIPFEDNGVTDARFVQLKKYFKKTGEEIIYVYDFGDHWKHSIILESIEKKDLDVAYCTGGENECPPEDVGGTPGYEQMLKCFQKGTTAEKKEYRDWLGMHSKENWNPGYFNMREISKRVALLYPEHCTFGK